MLQKPLESLKSRTFIGLLLAQFTATFNDQMIHIVAIFFASDVLVRYLSLAKHGIDEKAVISIVTACFITPFLIFSPYAGQLADKFSKRSIIVFWKLAEVVFMVFAAIGLSLPHATGLGIAPDTLALWSASIVVSCVFLMGVHSTFFVPAKYGVMPEILHPHILSRGNGFLEGTSFSAQIFGTSAGGIVYLLCKSEIKNGVLIPGNEWVIGLILLSLATLGTVTAVLMERIPAAAPHQPINWNWWQPMRTNLQILWSSRPLILAVTGIAFAAFMTLFLRQTLLYEGELTKQRHDAEAAIAALEKKTASPRAVPAAEEAAAPGEHADAPVPGTLPENGPRNPVLKLLGRFVQIRQLTREQLSELRVSLMIALVGLGVGIGSLLAGYLSGHRVELGLVPIGGIAMSLLIFVPAVKLQSASWMVGILFSIGVAAGLYIVPLYSLMQHRAPKKAKGNVVAASNFLNVAGGIVAVAMFYGLTFLLEGMFGTRQTLAEARVSPQALSTYLERLQNQMLVPRMLFVATGFFTLLAVLALCRRLPDFFVRSALWLGAWRRPQLRVDGLENLPVDGPVLLAANWNRLDEALLVVAASDRYARLIVQSHGENDGVGNSVRQLAKWSGLVRLPPQPQNGDWDRALQAALKTLKKGELVAFSVQPRAEDAALEALVTRLRNESGAQLVPVYCIPAGSRHTPGAHVVFGAPLSAGTSLEDARRSLAVLAETTG